MGNKLITTIILIGTVIVECITFYIWLGCKSFTDIFHIFSLNIKLQIESYIYGDKGTSLLQTRLFHNKFVVGIVDYLRLYLQFWDIRFGVNWFSILGYFGIFAGFYYFACEKEKKWWEFVLIVIIVLLPLIEIVGEPALPIISKSLYLWLPFVAYSLYGIYSFLRHGDKKKRVVVILILLLISAWWIIFLPNNLNRYCIR